MRVDAYLPKPLAAALHSLFLTLMADQTFKVGLNTYITVLMCRKLVVMFSIPFL
jgi:hypothetical protein